ncbi:MAG: AtpZ/AtpI family protein [Candidatus Oleimicrobiaceae bacterium]
MGREDSLFAIRQFAVAMAAVARVSALVLVCVGSPLALGLYLDRLLGTAPWLLLVGMVGGAALCALSVAAVARRQ